MKPYIRKVNYYETDMMGIVHHSNYIRWLEEARIDIMEQVKAPYKMLEDSGISIPVVSVSCEYKQVVKFGETVRIETKIEVFTGVRLEISYEVFSEETGELCTTARTTHCFVSASGRPISLKRVSEFFYDKFIEMQG